MYVYKYIHMNTYIHTHTYNSHMPAFFARVSKNKKYDKNMCLNNKKRNKHKKKKKKRNLT